jgi:hypothetical protein
VKQTGGFSPQAQRHLDGERVEQLAPDERDQADAMEAALKAYRARLVPPGAEVDRAVMKAVLDRSSKKVRHTIWNWLLQPRPMQVRPALVAAASVALVALGALALQVRYGMQSPPVEAASAQETILVRFELVAPAAERVTLAGSFNGWNPDGIELTRSPDNGLWTGTVPLVPGEHQYLFVIDGTRWMPDPTAQAQVDDGFGQTNSVIVVGPRGVVRS